jgi:hypothetical protein
MNPGLLFACIAVIAAAWCLRMATQNRERIKNLEEKLHPEKELEAGAENQSGSQCVFRSKVATHSALW